MKMKKIPVGPRINVKRLIGKYTSQVLYLIVIKYTFTLSAMKTL